MNTLAMVLQFVNIHLVQQRQLYSYPVLSNIRLVQQMQRCWYPVFSIFAVSNRCNSAQIQYSVIFALFNRCKDAQIQYSVIFALSNRCNDAWPYFVFTWSVNNTRPLWGLPLLLMQLLFATGGLCHGCTNMYTHTYGPLKGPIWSYEVEAVGAVKALTTWNK